MRQMVAFTLQDAGFQVTEAVDGRDALEKAKLNSYHLVITDVHMPNMDGISLVRGLRSLQAFKFTPILLLTTEASPEKKAEGRSAGATGWLVKPFDPIQLMATIRKVLG